MQTINATGSQLTPELFINTFREAKKLSPARFMTLRIHPTRYHTLYAIASVPESIQIGTVMGPLGKPVVRVNSIKPPIGVNDGVAVIVDPKADPTKLVWEIHGIPELVLENLAP